MQASTTPPNKILSILVPMHNEEACIDTFFETTTTILKDIGTTHGLEWEIIVVDDGSSDATPRKIEEWARREPRIYGCILSRNFGKEAALTAALDMARGDAVVPMDADLQDPPELLHEMTARWLAGAQMVIAVRTNRDADSAVKRTTSSIFYKVFNILADRAIPENAGDFRLMDRVIVNVLKTFPERSRFMKGIFSWVGFRTEEVYFVRPARARGETKWNYFKLLRLAMDGITSFSTFPLRVWLYIGLLFALLAFTAGLIFVVKTLLMGDPVQGFPTIIVSMLLLGGLQLISLGILGEYIGKIYMEVKRRPLYIVQNNVGNVSK